MARTFRKKRIPIDLIVIDFFHWPLMGDFRFDDGILARSEAMADELRRNGIRLMVSIWPQNRPAIRELREMRHHNYLAKTRQGKDVGMWWPRDNQFFDATNPAARDFVWELCRKNYTDLASTPSG